MPFETEKPEVPKYEEVESNNTDNTKKLPFGYAKSKQSGIAPYDTLFHDFNFDAFPIYNFWTQDEILNDQVIRTIGTKIEDLPRYVKLVWNPAPQFPDLQEEKVQNVRGGQVLYALGVGAKRGVVAQAFGTTFNPEPLQPLDFETACQFLADGYIAPGIAQGVVEAPIVEGVRQERYLDEDQFLASDTQGVTFNELDNALQERQSSVFGAQQQLFEAISDTADAQRNKIASQFGLTRTQSGYVDLVSANPSSPTISVFARSAVQGSTESYVDRMIDSFSVETGEEEQAANIRLVDTGFEGLFDESRVDRIRSPEHAESIVALASHADNLVVLADSGLKDQERSLEIPSFPAPSGLKPLEYVGYIIEKFEQINGAFKLIKTIYIPKREYTEYFDTQARYGAIYRYRIRSVLRWTRKHGYGITGFDNNSVAAQNESITALAPNDASFFGGEWCKKWAYAAMLDTALPDPPDELRVIPCSHEKSIRIAMRIPADPQLDLSGMKLLRKIRRADGTETSWTEIAQFEVANSGYVDSDVDYFDTTGNRYIYSAVTVTKHSETSFMAEQISARITTRWEKEGELPNEFVSCAGVDLKYSSGIFAVRPHPNPYTELISESGEVVFKSQERTAKSLLSNSAYTIRLESLDTGESVDVPLRITVNNLPSENQEIKLPVTPAQAL